MPLPSASPRKRLHTRQVRYEGYARDDGLFDVDATLLDVKDHDCALLSGVREAGDPVHAMAARVTIDRHGVIQSVATCSDRVPYTGYCEEHGNAYRALVGLSLFDNFRLKLFAAVGRTHGCTHLTELLAYLPTAALQTFAGLQREDAGERKPFQLDRCHALRSDGAAVQRYYPKWHRAAAPLQEGRATPAEPAFDLKEGK